MTDEADRDRMKRIVAEREDFRRRQAAAKVEPELAAIEPTATMDRLPPAPAADELELERLARLRRWQVLPDERR